MSDDIFVGVVPVANSYEPTWHGVFRFDEITGYVGKLLSTKFDFKPGLLRFNTPEELEKDALFCIVNGNDPSTAIWPGFYGRTTNLTGPGSTIIEVRIPTLIRGVHIGENELRVQGLTLSSPIIALLFGMKGYRDRVSFKPASTQIETVHNNPIRFDVDRYSIEIGTSQSYGSSKDKLRPILDVIGYAKVGFKAPLSPVQALNFATQMEYFLSLVCLGFISGKRLNFAISKPSSSGETIEEAVDVIRAKRVEGAKTEVNANEIPISLKEVDLGTALERFIAIFDSIEQSLSWYRIVMAEDRYVEDKYFYAARMIEALYKSLEFRREIEGEPAKNIDMICNKLPDDSEKSSLIKFLNNRVRPIFKQQWSLSSVLKDLKVRYSEIKLVEILDEGIASRVRNKEAHGTTAGFSIAEQKFMAHTYDLIAVLYALIVLEQCGLERSSMLSGLSNFRNHFFSNSYLKKVLDDLAI